MLSIGQGIGIIIFTVISQQVHYWKNLNLYSLLIPSIVCLFFFIFIQESPRYVFSKNKRKGKDILNKIAKINNKKEIKDKFFKRISMSVKYNERKKIYSYIDLFKYRSLRWTTIGAMIYFFSLQTLYYGSDFGISNLGGFNFYQNIFYATLVEIIAKLITSNY